MLLRIEGRDLPGMPGVAVAVQARVKPYDLLEPVRGDAAAAAWDVPVEPFTTKHGERTLRGPHVTDGIGGRFVYLSWIEFDADGAGRMFRRAKLMLSGIPEDVYEAGIASGTLRARMRLTDAKGLPISARLVPPEVEWTAD